MSASVSCVVFAMRRRSAPTRRVSSTKNGISAKANSASCQLSSSIATIVATIVVTFDAIDVAVFVTTFWMPPMSFEIRDCTSPVRVRVKNASESRCRWRKTAARRSCITRWPTWLESSVCHTPIAPLTIAITIIPAASSESCFVSFALMAFRAPRSRKAGMTPSTAEITISVSTADSRNLYGVNSRPARRRVRRRVSGSAVRSGSWLTSNRRWPGIQLRVRGGGLGTPSSSCSEAPSASSSQSEPAAPTSDTLTGRPVCAPTPAGSATTGKPVQFQ